MRKAQLLVACSLLLGGSLVTEAQKETPKPQNNGAAIEREIREFYDSYAEDLRQHRREAIADRYDQRRVFFHRGLG